MADNNDHISNTSKPAKTPAEKKKRKRPSKKVPTTYLQANNSGFMHLVQKLTGSAEELAAATVDSSTHSQSQSSPYSSPSNQLEPMTTYQSTGTPDVDTYPYYSSTTPSYSNAPSYSMGSYIQEQYQPYQDPAPSNYGYGGGYGGTGGYGSGGYGESGGYGGSGSRSYGEEDENSTYGYRGGSGDRYNNNNGSSPSSSTGVDTHEGSPNEFGNHNSSSHYYW